MNIANLRVGEQIQRIKTKPYNPCYPQAAQHPEHEVMAIDWEKQRVHVRSSLYAGWFGFWVSFKTIESDWMYPGSVK